MSSGALKRWNKGHNRRAAVPRMHSSCPLPHDDKGRTCAKVDRKERTRQNFQAFFHSTPAPTPAIDSSHASTALPSRIPIRFSPANAALAVASFSAPERGGRKQGDFRRKVVEFCRKVHGFYWIVPVFFIAPASYAFDRVRLFFDRTWVFRSTSANFCFDRAYILCIFATIYYHHRTRSRKGHRLP